MISHQEIIDDITKSMRLALCKTSYINLLEKRGYGIVSLAGIVGEVGDVRRFSNHKKLSREIKI